MKWKLPNFGQMKIGISKSWNVGCLALAKNGVALLYSMSCPPAVSSEMAVNTWKVLIFAYSVSTSFVCLKMAKHNAKISLDVQIVPHLEV